MTTGTDVTSDGFTGRRWQASGSLVLAQYRAYDPDLGQWLSEDPSGFADGPNMYAYVTGNPVLWTDPDGLQLRRCPPKVFAVLRAAVLATCNTPRKCTEADSCNKIRLKMLTIRLCIAAQRELTRRCYSDNPTHQKRITDEQNALKRCQGLLAEKQKCECK